MKSFRAFLALSVVSFLLISTSRVSAQVSSNQLDLRTSDNDPLQLPLGIPPLPGPDDTESQLMINPKNVALFHELLLAPMAMWVKDGKCQLRAVRNLNFLWQLSPAWREQTNTNPTRFAIDKNFNLTLNGDLPESGFPFGNSNVIDESRDPISKAYQILWNSQYALAAAEDLFYEVGMEWMGNRMLLRTASGAYYRRFSVHPRTDLVPRLSTPPADANTTSKLPSAAPAFNSESDLMLEEVLRLTTPPVVFGFGEISWRYRNTPEDLLWVHSPVIARSRQIFSSNRGDSLFSGQLSFDDLFVWSDKVQSVKGRVIDEKVMLLPFPALDPYRIDTEKVSRESLGTPEVTQPGSSSPVKSEDAWTIHGPHNRSDTSSTMMLWNYETGRAPRAAYWCPSTVAFIPRRVWIVEASPRDPFYLGGRRVLIIDKESMLPFYKIVYNQNGDLQKLVLGGWGLGGTDDSSIRFPFLTFALAVDARGETATALRTHSLKIFSNSSSKVLGELRQMLDISTYRTESRVAESKEPKTEPEEPADDETPTEATPDAGGF